MNSRLKEIWIIDDPLDGMHIFRSKKEADKQLEKWMKESKGNANDSVWDMTGPYKFIRIDE
jgi:hypothetical protein